MISVVGVYNDVRFRVNKENGFLSTQEFNDASWMAQLSMIDWITGGSSGTEVPQLYLNQKNRDWISFLIEKYQVTVSDGIFTKPVNYYLFENLYKVNGPTTIVIDGSPVAMDIPDYPISLLSNNKFNVRANSNIEELKPSLDSAISKMFLNKIQILPKNIGDVILEYIRYPIKSLLVTVRDTTYQEDVPNENASTHFEWGEYARGLLVWFIVDEIANHTREGALKQFNTASGGKK